MHFILNYWFTKLRFSKKRKKERCLIYILLLVSLQVCKLVSFSLSVYTLGIMYTANDTRDLILSDKIDKGIESLDKVCLSLRGRNSPQDTKTISLQDYRN